VTDVRATIVAAALDEHDAEYAPLHFTGVCSCGAEVNVDTFTTHQAAAVLAALSSAVGAAPRGRPASGAMATLSPATMCGRCWTRAGTCGSDT
jgi:hypothetical protein